MTSPSFYPAGRCLIITACFCATIAAALGQESPSSATAAAQTRPSAESTPRQIMEQTIPQVTSLLLDRSTPPENRADRLQEIITRRIDFQTLSRIMLGQAWDGLPQAQRDDFVDVFTDYLMGVYVPLMNEYKGQQVRITEDYPVGRADHTVTMRVSDTKGGGERQIALISCRLRHGEQGWEVIDVTIEGISVARVFGAQFRPVFAREGMDGLLRQMREKSARGKSAR